MASTFTGGLKSILNSDNSLRADITVNDMQINGDIDILGELCITDGVKDNVCLNTNGVIIDPTANSASTFQVFDTDGVTPRLTVDTLAPNVDINTLLIANSADINKVSIGVNGSSQIDNSGTGEGLTVLGDIGLTLGSTIGDVVVNSVAGDIDFRLNNASKFKIDNSADIIATASRFKINVDSAEALSIGNLADTLNNLQVNTVTKAISVNGTSTTAFGVYDDDTTTNHFLVDTSTPQITARGDNAALFRVNNAADSLTSLSCDTLTGDITVNGMITSSLGNDLELKVGGTDNIVFTTGGNRMTVSEGELIVDSTDVEAFLVRRNNDSGDIFTVDTSNQEVEIGGNGIKYPTTGGTADLVDYFEDSYTLTSNYTGPASINNVDHYVTKHNKVITILFSGEAKTSGSSTIFTSSSTLATRFRPANDRWFVVPVTVAGNEKLGFVHIVNSGIIEIWNADASGLAAAFPGSGSVGWTEFTITYRLI